MRWFMGWLIACATACIEPRLVPCGDQLCPRGSTCVADSICATTEDIAACDGLSEGDPCVGGSGGTCMQGVCVSTVCGNSVVDVGETCDDGNTASGDGCRADCRKIELCGDGELDEGEGCDDGNTNPADGCDACNATVWRTSALVGGAATATMTALEYLSRIAVDLHGNVYLSTGYYVYRIDTSGVATVVAGNGQSGSAGDGGPATSAQISAAGMAVDGLGNIYFADPAGNRIRRVDDFGVITTVAGTGTGGFGGDNGPATAADLAAPAGVAVDGLGNIYIADTGNERIRRVDLSGTITTIAGTTSGFGGDGGAATAAQLSGPAAVVLGPGGIYIADSGNFRVRKIASSGVITTVVGDGTYGSSGDGGPATSAGFYTLRDIAFDAAGNMYIADYDDSQYTTYGKIRKVATDGVISTFAGNSPVAPLGDGGQAFAASIRATGVASDGQRLFIADSGNYRARRVDTTGVITTIAGNGDSTQIGDGRAAIAANFATPMGLAIDGAGRVLIADYGQHRVRRVDLDGVIATIAGTGVDGFSGDGGPATAAKLSEPMGVAIDDAGNIYIAEYGGHRVRRIDTAGTITTVAGTGVCGATGDGGPATSAQLCGPYAVVIDASQRLVIADTGNGTIRRVDANGTITKIAGATSGSTAEGVAATTAQLGLVDALAVRGTDLYLTDFSRVRKIDANGIITTVAGTTTVGFSGDGGPATSAMLDEVDGIAFDAAGNLLIAEYIGHRVRRVATNGIISTIAGTGVMGYTGDGGAATSAQLYFPARIASAGGTIYLSVFGLVRRIDANGTITTFAGGRTDPAGMGPIATGRLADPNALVIASPFTLIAGGTSGTLQAIRTSSPTKQCQVVAGRYPQDVATGTLARFRGKTFGEVSGVAYDAAMQRIYLTESHRVYVVTMPVLADENTWTIAPLVNSAGVAGFADGAAATAKLSSPTGLYFDEAARQLYVADTGNHAVRAIDLTTTSATVRTIAGTPKVRGFFGDGGEATTALLYAPRAITRCGNGDLFIADTGNDRVRRVANNVITTVAGVGVGASSGEGSPATTFPVNAPRALACDALGNLFITSTTTVRLVPADATGAVTGTGPMQTIYGKPPRERFPESVTSCLTGLAVVDATHVQVTDSCTGLLIDLERQRVP